MIHQYFEESRRKWLLIIGGLSCTLTIAFVLSLALGSVNIPIGKTLQFFIGSSTGERSWDLILLNFRLPKALTAVAVGSALGISGLQMQTLFRNPLAGPFVLGITSGAGLGVALVIFLGFILGGFLELSGIGRNWLLVLSAGMGSFLVLLIVTLTALKIKENVSLLIVGLMFGTVASAVISVLQFFSQSENIQAYVIWSFGSLGSVAWSELYVMMPIVIIGLISSILISKPLNALLLGEHYAISLGINIKRIRLVIIIITSLLAGTITAFCGPVAFMGIAVPHLSRMLFNTSNHLLLTPVIILFGATLMLIFDLIAQLPGSDLSLPINSVTALFGAPFVIYLLIRKKSLNYS
ncbi:MAG: iron ABC transporter permease [Cyclobacteriaceae bacterium]|nr:iron ABC transporter permease [Cyclobacteriaceae bacterium HetDA_MAG_MS6]